MMLLMLIVTLALAVSALCSILEATLLSTNVADLARRADGGDKGAQRLLDLKEHKLEDAIGAILTYNTIAHTIGAALSGAQAAVVFGDPWVGLFSAVLTLLILIFTEIIPKTAGTVYAGQLAGFTGGVIAVMIMPPMKWVLVVTRALTRLIAPKEKEGTTRGDVKAMVKLAARDGGIDRGESKILTNLLRFKEVTVEAVMTPRTVMVMVDRARTVDDVLTAPEVKAFSRLPVYGDNRDDIEGYVLVRDLFEVALGGGTDQPLDPLVRPVVVIDEATTVGSALEELTSKHEHFAIVLDELGVVTGLVSLEDLFETALGTEIVDEYDQVADLRKQALELREQRLGRLRARWKPKPTAGE